MNLGNPDFSPGTIAYTNITFCLSDSLPYVAYRDEVNSYKATVKKFDGSSWVDVGMEGFSTGAAYFVSLAVISKGQPFVAYSDDSNSGKATVMY